MPKENRISFSINGKVKLLDPVANQIGLAFEAEATLGSDYHVFSPKLILDKRFGNNYLSFNVWAAILNKKQVNSTTDIPSITAPTVTNASEPPIEFDIAYMHFSKNGNLAFGFESRLHTESTDFAAYSGCSRINTSMISP